MITKEHLIDLMTEHLHGTTFHEADPDQLLALCNAAIEAYKAKLLDGVGEPVAFVDSNCLDNISEFDTTIYWKGGFDHAVPLYTADQMAAAVLRDIEAMCARIKAADDAAADNDYMLDSDDCISVIRGTWKGPMLNDCPPAIAPKAEPVLQDIEQYRMQMAGICTAALGYWKEGDSIHPDYDTPALRDVANLYAKYNERYKAKAEQSEPICYASINKQGDVCSTLKQRDSWRTVPLYTHPAPEAKQPVNQQLLAALKHSVDARDAKAVCVDWYKLACAAIAAAEQAPQPAELTDEELNKLADRCTSKGETGTLSYRKYARAVLAAAIRGQR